MMPIVITSAGRVRRHQPAGNLRERGRFLGAWGSPAPPTPQPASSPHARMPGGARAQSPAKCGRTSTTIPIAFQEKSRNNPMTGNEFFEWVNRTFAPFPRHHLRHCPSRPAVSLRQLGTFHRTRRQHRAHPEREVRRPAPDSFEEKEVDKETDYHWLSRRAAPVSALEALSRHPSRRDRRRRVAEIMISTPSCCAHCATAWDEAIYRDDSPFTESSRIPRRIVAEINAKLRYGNHRRSA